jgi:hypothetical protein
LAVLKTKAGIAGGSEAEKRIGPVPDGKNFLSMECAHRVRFSVRRFCETNRLFDVEAAKTLGNIEDLCLPCTRTSHIVKQLRRTIARPAWQSIYFEGWFRRDGGGEINLLKAGVLR